MKIEKFVNFLERELEVLTRKFKKELSEGEYPDGNKLRLKELALKSALDFYLTNSSLLDIGDFELSNFLSLFNKALKMTPLSPIQEDEFWNEETPGFYTNDRYHHLQKMVDPETKEIFYADDTRFITCNVRNLQRRFPDYKELDILLDLYPITFPYTPLSKPIVLYVDDDNQTKYIMYAYDSEGRMQSIKRVFRKVNDVKWEEITKK